MDYEIADSRVLDLKADPIRYRNRVSIQRNSVNLEIRFPSLNLCPGKQEPQVLFISVELLSSELKDR